jgi:hypothetical protein
MSTIILPKGYGFRTPRPGELLARGSLLDVLEVFERPRTRGERRYVIGVDVGDGIGQDRSVVNVTRVGTLQEPAEQVAQYVSDAVLPVGLAYTIQTLGQWYLDEDGYEALVAVEVNNHGLATQNALQLHLGYTHFYVWEYYDAHDPSRRLSTKIGWATTPRTRPLLLAKFHAALTTTDPITNFSDYIIHSPLLLDELKDFQTEGALWEAAAAAGAHDDCIMAAAIAYYVAWTQQAGETEPLEDRRRRRSEQQVLAAAAAAEGAAGGPPDWRNTPATADEHNAWAGKGGDVEDLDEQLYDPRAHDESVGW